MAGTGDRKTVKKLRGATKGSNKSRKPTPKPRQRTRKAEKWCHKENAWFPKSEFAYDNSWGWLHKKGEKPLHNINGDVYHKKSTKTVGLPAAPRMRRK